MADIEQAGFKVGDFAKLVGVSVATLQRWDRNGILVAYRTPTNRRYYTQAQADEIRGRREAFGCGPKSGA